jgi:hypothetical protein
LWFAAVSRAGAYCGLALASEGDQAMKYLNKGVSCYRTAIDTISREKLPNYWAAIQNNLGNALRELEIRRSGENGNSLLFQAVEAYQASLQVRTREEVPLYWAMTQTNLGTVLLDLGLAVVTKRETNFWSRLSRHTKLHFRFTLGKRLPRAGL